MSISVTELRNNLYKKFDQVIATGEPIYIERKGYKLKIDIEQSSVFSLKNNLRTNSVSDSNISTLDKVRWEDSWTEGKKLDDLS